MSGKVWLAFWGASINDAELSAENARRYNEWRGLILSLLDPLTNEPIEECEALIALVDGLGLALARSSLEGAPLKDKQAACEAVLDRYLKRLDV